MENELGNKTSSGKVIWIVVGVIIVVGAAAAVYFTTRNDDTDTNATTNTAVTTANTDTTVDPYADLMQYDGTTVDITSTDGKVTGQVAFSFDMTQAQPITVVYFLKVKDNLPKSAAATGGGATYYYITNHTSADAINDGSGTGALTEAFCNADQTPDVLALAEARSIDLDMYMGCDAQYDPYHTTDTFYLVYSGYYDSDSFDYDRIVTDRDTLAVFDTAPYYEADAETGGYGADDATVIAEATPTATYDLTYTD